MQTMLRTLSVLTITLTLTACGSSSAPADSGNGGHDAAPDAPDTSTADTGSTDSDAGSDAGSAVEAGADALDAASDAAVPDDVRAVDVTPADASATCDYVDVDDVVVRCGVDYRFVGLFSDSNGSPDCPGLYSTDGTTFYATRADAIAAAGCTAECEWHFATAVDRLYCGHRTGYETLEATGCPTIYRFPEGYFSSVDEHDTKYPCDDAGVGDGG